MPVNNANKPEKLFIVEMMPNAGMKFDGNVVALTPEVIFALSSRGIPFTIPDDYFSMDSYCAHSETNSTTFNDWIESIDNELFNKFKALRSFNIKPARLYGYYLQLLIDPFVVATLRMKAIIKNLNPKEVVFCCCKQREEPVDYQLFIKGCSIESILIPFLCQKYKIAYTVKNVPKRRSFRCLIRSVLKSARIIKNNLKNCILLFSRSYPRNYRASMLLLAKTWDIERIGASAQKKGYRLIGAVPKYDFNENLEKLPHSDIAILESIGKVFDDVATEKISVLYTDRLKYFFNTICPNIELSVKYYLDIFKKQKIKFVLTPYKNRFEDFSVMAAANIAKDTLAIQIDHGYSAFDLNWWKYTEQPCNLYIAVTDELKQYHVDKVFKETKNTEIKLAESWTKKYRDIEKNRTGWNDRKTVLYIPTITSRNLERNDGAGYFNTWYFMHQSKLLKYFYSESNFDFVCKYAPNDSEILDPISRIIRNAGWKNIVYTDGDLCENIKMADLAVLDYPSTPFLEAALAGIPTICLYYERSPIRVSAKEFFGKMLQPFLTTDEAIEKIRMFLMNNPGDYIRSFTQGEEDIFKIIQENADRILALKLT